MPAAAVIPAPIAYIKVVAVKKLVVEFLGRAVRVHFGVTRRPDHPREYGGAFTGSRLAHVLYCEKIRVFKAGFQLEYISME